VAVICGFFADEPIDILFKAAGLIAGQIKDVNFYLTGDAKRLDPACVTRNQKIST